VGSEYNPNAEAEKTAAAADKPKKKTVGDRLRGALGGGRKKDDASKGKVDAKGSGKKISAPRKAGGS
jgi:hypothetical protein